MEMTTRQRMLLASAINDKIRSINKTIEGEDDENVILELEADIEALNEIQEAM